MNARNSSIFLIALWAYLPADAFSRLIELRDPRTCIADSKLVFVGRVRSLKPSGITTRLSYGPWAGVTFKWLVADVEVMEPLKGVRRAEIVHAAILSYDAAIEDPPLTLDPDNSDVFLFCLGATPLTDLFAAITAPYDESLSVLTLHRSQRRQDEHRDLIQHVLRSDSRFAPIWKLVDETGEVMPAGAAHLREFYAAEINKAPSSKLIYLEWERASSARGWQSDVPKRYYSATNSTTITVVLVMALILVGLILFARKRHGQ